MYYFVKKRIVTNPPLPHGPAQFTVNIATFPTYTATLQIQVYSTPRI